ncbi:Abortive infection protein [Prochlorococcus marinus subsp. pastoris str. CCMP1986]|uniref:Abortive infection protein n=1 Tax=Prochlorococcus marinus subsp. pastoris (strain CCMP1986 / NIES-2087 / MED4) TaxID=59919 RepID=Q7V2V6_PROMP|nr:type II CAAX endopeptidase family protein [Prochlorococcus marinus]KGF86327.1 Metal-dependent membrane protease [Prochlorococcus marinus str. EQPAC1]CAE18811.1 Abortive infection protein [Prochlorococcus marinus subsp. pastoris str. CCMP1986]|tara:strand:- start:264 stop:1142 length:879 start_codon:yes stop_codon:yes gene_type:complete
MSYIFKTIKIIIKNFLIFRPRIILTILFIPLLYLLGWILAKPLIFIGIGKENISLIGTIFTFSLFVISIPKWFEIRWGCNNPWVKLGINKIDKKENRFFYFIKGLLYSIILLSLILIPIVRNQWGNWLGTVSPNIFLNSLLLIIGIGFVEELIFRGWLLEELKNQVGFKKGLIFQALVFSFVHIGFDMPFWQMISILFGLFLLGIVLSIIRIKDENSLWGCAGLHGGLVGIWFLMNNGLIEISKDAPIWLVGPGNINTNPLGGFYGITLLIMMFFYNLFKYKNKIINLNNDK